MIPFRLQTGRNGQQEISVATPLEFLFFAGWFVAWREKRYGIKGRMIASMNRKWDLSGIGGRE